MAESQGISGLGVALATAGGLAVWAAIRNVTPVDVLKETLGRPHTATPISRPFTEVQSGVKVVEGFGPAAGSSSSGVGTLTPAGEAGELVTEARKHIGAPYVWATAGPNTFDCSGLVVYCLRKIGVAGVPRFTTYTFGTWAKSKGWAKVGPSSFRAGDVVVRTGHMGIAVSATRMIHAPTTGQRVREAEIYDRGNWWGWRMVASRPAGQVQDAKRR